MDFKNVEYIVSLWLRDRRFVNAQNDDSKGFTLIELLVVIIIIGILAAIALPSFLSQANKARYAEAKSFIGTMSRLQQAYYLEKQTFAGSITQLSLGANTSSGNFSYSIITGSVTGTPTPVELNQIVTNAAQPTSSTLKAFVGVVGIPGVVRIDTVFCIANSPNITINPGSLNISAQTMVCPSSFSIE
ncbi:type IV pilin-like G/H family protein [Pseudanabaena sp. ABRG5-3]|uniref:type IV pilin-like G/H family protein n=1 Tax=Pseudanabaena sp. ABRG5-3 TaxID=685565 RepID=UPI000DC7326E|nr:type IV pilin-like G/H family protein [Pseudanabaena sp. ABRG5-3]BBC22539.1 general secretion pathway protein H [Pseudanabaena sp. ABRG5-3]